MIKASHEIAMLRLFEVGVVLVVVLVGVSLFALAVPGGLYRARAVNWFEMTMEQRLAMQVQYAVEGDWTLPTEISKSHDNGEITCETLKGRIQCALKTHGHGGVKALMDWVPVASAGVVKLVLYGFRCEPRGHRWITMVSCVRQQFSLSVGHRVGTGALMFANKTIPSDELAFFFKQLSNHLKGGVSMDEALACIVEESTPKMVRWLAVALAADLLGGVTIEAAFSKQAERFGPVIARRIAAAPPGSIEQTSADIAEFLRRRTGLDERITYLDAWQKLTVVIAVLVTSLIVVFVAPAFAETFRSFGGDLPEPTRLVFALSEIIADWWWVLLLIGVAFLVARQRVPAVALAWGKLALALPGVGRKTAFVGAAMVVDAAAFLAHQGIGAGDSVRCAAASLRNARLSQLWNEVAAKLDAGKSWAEALSNSAAAPRSLVAHCKTMPDASLANLQSIVDANREVASEFVAGYGQKSRRVVSVALGVLIGFLLISLYLPIFKLGAVVG